MAKYEQITAEMILVSFGEDPSASASCLWVARTMKNALINDDLVLRHG
jgi:hypothetical protein